MNTNKQSLLTQIQKLPTSSGVYHYMDKNGKLLYVGKAKNLKARVKSYFRFADKFVPNPNLNARLLKMLDETYDMHYILVDSEHDALILEDSLIKQLRPKYNILLRDDKTYPYIYIDKSQKFPRFELTRKLLSNSKIEYFGPFSLAGHDILNAIYETVPLVQKKSCLSAKKACLYYQIKKCPAPCEEKITPKEYNKYVEKAISYINNKELLIRVLEEKMVQLSKELRFEEAATLRDSINRISKSTKISQIDIASSEDIDLFCVDFQEGTRSNKARAIILRLFMRKGKIISTSHNFIVLNHGFDRDEIYKRAILEFYQFSPLTAKQVLVAHEFEQMQDLQEYLKHTFSKKITILMPKRGAKTKLCKLALKNSKELLLNYSKHTDKTYENLQEKLQELCSLELLPRKIEIFDNSHLQGTVPVGAMVCFEDGKFIKSSYRRYHLNSRDEYAQMKELLTRRVNSFEKEPAPDLWILDGGAALLKLALNILNSYGVNLDVIAISKEKIDAKAHRAKGRAKDIIHTKDESFSLATSDKRLQWVQRLRDEAHRFAIGFHKKSKVLEDKKSSLLQTKGIGIAKIRKLLNHFGSFEEIQNADKDDLAKIVGINYAIIINNLYK